MNIEKNMDLFLRLLSNAEYYQAHDVLEELWKKMKKENHQLSNLVKGLINAAVAFEHIKRASPGAFAKAQKTFAGFIKYKDGCKYMSNELNPLNKPFKPRVCHDGNPEAFAIRPIGQNCLSGFIQRIQFKIICDTIEKKAKEMNLL